jgi:ferredoxin-NADP reductase
MRRWGIAVVLLVSAAGCGPVTPTYEELRAAQVTRQQQQVAEVYAAQQVAEPRFRAQVAACVERSSCAIAFYIHRPYSLHEMQEKANLSEVEFKFAVESTPNARIRGPRGCEFGYRKCMEEADPSGEFNKWNSYWEYTDPSWGGGGYAAGYDDGYEDGQDDD